MTTYDDHSDALDAWGRDRGRTVFVSSGRGDDANDGLSSERPKRTVQAGLQSLREGYPDWLILRPGETYNADWKLWPLLPGILLLVAAVTGGFAAMLWLFT